MMKMKRIILNIAVISCAFLLFTIWYQKCIETTVPTTSASLLVRNYKIYLITTDKNYQYWEFMNQGASDMAAQMGLDYIWDAPAERNVERQIEVINRAVNNGADALLVAADDPVLITSVIEDAKARGVKVIYVDSPANEEAIITLATNNYDAGVIAGQTMIAALDELGIEKGSIGIISVAEKENSDLRDKGFRRSIEADGRFILLDTVYTNGEPVIAQNAAQRVIKENSDLIGLYGTNEGTSVGVGYAIRANDNRFVGIGYDRTDAMVELLRSGSIKAIIDQNPYTMGYLGIAEAVAALLGKNTGPDYIDTGITIVEE